MKPSPKGSGLMWGLVLRSSHLAFPTMPYAYYLSGSLYSLANVLVTEWLFFRATCSGNTQHSIISDNNTHPTWDILPAKRHLSSDGHCSVSVRDLDGLIPYGGVYPYTDGTGQGHASPPPWCSHIQCSTRRLQLFLSTR